MTAIEVRNITLDLGEHIPRYWHGERRAVSAFFDNLSIFFPAGERFFIASVKAHRDHVTDPELAAAVRAFCAQEAVHGREHDRYNAMIEAHGRPAARMDGRVKRLLARVSRRVPKRMQLAATCALEHFTALLADIVLRDPRVLEGADPVMAALWRWHAAEENEHKAVAFDVYMASGGNYLERVAVMLAATVIFWAKVLEHQVRLMHADRTLWSPREWLDLARFVFVNPGWAVQLAPGYLHYFRPRFHPWQLDNRELLEKWKRESAESPWYRRVA